MSDDWPEHCKLCGIELDCDEAAHVGYDGPYCADCFEILDEEEQA